ncbi:MAG: AAA family ATPase [Solirubrobacteraceae bacterium]
MNRRAFLQTASAVAPAPARWAWQGRFALGNINLLAGREGLGKTTVMEGLLALATQGRLEGDLLGEPVDVIYCTAEDSIEATLVPRFLAAAGDPTRMHFLAMRTEDKGATLHSTLTLPGDNALLADAIDAVRARIVVLDPLVGFMDSSFNSHRDQHVRRILGPLAHMASSRDMSVIGLIHMNKGESNDALTRISGSVGFAAAARSVLVLAADPDDPEGERGHQRILAHAKCNLGRKQTSITGRIDAAVIRTDDDQVITTSKFVLVGESDRNASDLMAPAATSEERGVKAKAKAFLLDVLADGPMPSRQLKEEAQEAGLTWRAIERAQAEMPSVSPRKVGKHWQWELVTAVPALATPLGGVGGDGGDGRAISTKTTNSTEQAYAEAEVIRLAAKFPDLVECENASA